MLSYIVSSVERLIIMAILVGLAEAYRSKCYGEERKGIDSLGILVGIVVSFIMFYFKTYTSLVHTGIWNLRTFSMTAISIIVFSILRLIPNRSSAKETVEGILLSLYEVFIILYHLPAVLEMPHTMLLTDGNIMSTSFLLKMVGLIFGVLICIFAGVSICQVGIAMDKSKTRLFFILANIINFAKYIGLALSVMLARRMIPNNHTLFQYARYTSNYSDIFIYLIMILVLVMAISVIIQAMKQNEPYSNPAQRRKILAKWMHRRRYATFAIILLLIVTVDLTAVAGYVNRPVELSPLEDLTISDGKVTIPLEQVSDGDLHRFAIYSDEGTEIRFIIIQKPNSTALGVGLDACEICGASGYYMRDGQVICSLCDVVMNINTIGFKGGCNPIPFDYSIENGNFVTTLDTLLSYEDEFK